MKANNLLRDALDTTYEITKLVKLSPKRDSIFKKIRNELAIDQPGLRVLCPTRWTVRADALASILFNYEALFELWDEAMAVATDSETKVRLIGVATQMKSFDFFFGCTLGEKILRHTDNLSKSLQTVNISAADGQREQLQYSSPYALLRNLICFGRLLQSMPQNSVNEPTLPRKKNGRHGLKMVLHQQSSSRPLKITIARIILR